MTIFLPFDDHFQYCLMMTFVAEVFVLMLLKHLRLLDVGQVDFLGPVAIDVLTAMISVRRRC